MSFITAQLQNFTLSGSGVSIGDTTLGLSSFESIDGVPLSMVDIGDIGYGTLEPGSSNREEQISFTGVTQNLNGTATLTGVKNVLFLDPYTQTSGFQKSHPGGVKFVISNTSGFYKNIKDYIDTAIVSGAVPATTSVNGIVRMVTAPATASIPLVVGDNDPRVPTSGEAAALASTTTPGASNLYITQKDFQIGSEIYGADSGSTDDYVITITPAPAAYVTGMVFRFKANTVNTAACTLQVNSLAAIAIRKNYNVVLATGDIKAGQDVAVIYDGTNFQMISPISNFPPVSTGSATHDTSTTGAQTIAHGLGVVPRLIKISSMFSRSNTESATSMGTFDGTNTNEINNYILDASSQYFSESSSVSVVITTAEITGAATRAHATCAVDSTNITLTWTKDGSITGTVLMIWEAYA